MMLRTTMTAVLLAGIFGTSSALPQEPSRVEFEGVRSVWVSASQWPNSRTQETFAKDAVRLYGAEKGTPQDKALAIYYQ